MAVENTLMNISIFIFIIILSSLPLYFAVLFFGGRTNILKTFLVMLLIAFISTIITLALPIYGIFVSWFVLIWIFHEIFRLKISKAILVWIFWILFVFVFNFLFSLFGFSKFLFI